MLSRTGLSPSLVGLPSTSPLASRFLTPSDRCSGPVGALNPPCATPASLARTGFRLLPFRSPLLGEYSLFLRVLRCFSSPRSPRRTYVFGPRYPGIPPGGFPHSDISGSSLADSSPKLFAVNHVLHRLLAPRHPPCALSSLTTTCDHTKLI